jgi:hypothetical protein
MLLCTISLNLNDFYCPLYTLLLINATPPLSTNVINNDDISSSTTSKLDFNQFTYSSGDNASDDALSDTIPNITTLKSPCKRRWLATSI